MLGSRLHMPRVVVNGRCENMVCPSLFTSTVDRVLPLAPCGVGINTQSLLRAVSKISATLSDVLLEDSGASGFVSLGALCQS
jgi:hypothetical protein